MTLANDIAIYLWSFPFKKYGVDKVLERFHQI